MSAEQIVIRLRYLLFGLTAFICSGTLAELWLAGHTEETVQWIPFVVSALGLVAVVVVWLHPTRQTIWRFRAVMVIVAVTSLLGVYYHLSGNFAFELEIRPGVAASDVILEALQGANPLLAPGVMALASTLGIAATYYHPALSRSKPKRDVQ